MENNNNDGEVYIRVKDEENSVVSFTSGAVTGFFVGVLLVSIVKSSIRILTD